jgi:hypothetical protein
MLVHLRAFLHLQLILILILPLMRLQGMMFYFRAFLLRLHLQSISKRILRLMLRLQAMLFHLRAFLPCLLLQLT